jgi:hypothetical protein
MEIHLAELVQLTAYQLATSEMLLRCGSARYEMHSGVKGLQGVIN